MMNKEEFAALLNGREYTEEMTKQEEVLAKESGLFVVFGASDDLMEFRGAIYDELGAWEGTIAYLDKNGLLQNSCEDDRCPYFLKSQLTAKTIKACFDKDGYSWLYETEIPHATFEIMEGVDTYCRGLVISMSDLV